MKVQCKHCLPKEGIEIPDFTKTDKKVLHEMKLKSPFHPLKYLIDDFKLTHLDAKYITLHINKDYGRCNRCFFHNLDEEYIKCPKCGALNFNWNINDEVHK
jgi:hypothetical protein